jgi:Rad3-related DNA helicase
VHHRFLQEYRGVIIGDECGLGKTLQAIGAAYLIFLEGKERNDPRKVGFVYKSKGLRKQLRKELREFCQALEDHGLPHVCYVIFCSSIQIVNVLV